MSDSSDDIPDFDILVADPEIAALLEFEPVPRKRVVAEGAWTPDVQRKFVAFIAATGVRSKAADGVRRDVGGASKLCRAEGGAGFRDACDAAMELYQRRRQAQAEANRGGRWAPRLYGEASTSSGQGPSTSSGHRPSTSSGRTEDTPAPGQVVNEYGEWEDGGSYAQRAEEARDSVSAKLLRCRRLFLMSISGQPVKRAAFELLTELPVDWDLAAQMKPQPDEPWRPASMRRADMLLTAENGWMGDYVHGPNKRAELLRQLNDWRAGEGLAPLSFDDEEGDADQ